MNDFLNFVDRMIVLRDASGVKMKLDVLERLIQVARFELGHDANGVDLSTFLRRHSWSLDASGALVVHPSATRDSATRARDYRRADELEGPLLVFLLIRHREKRRILETIERFVSEVRIALSALDFERTQTGVVRCYTTTRFAANRLRGYGLLRYGRDEAFKHWTLTFLGVTVAASIYQEGWRVNARRAEGVERGPLLAEQIRRTLRDLEAPDAWGEVLNRLCGASGMPFPPYDDLCLEAAARLVARFNEVARFTRPADAAREECCRLTDELDRLPWVKSFVEALRIGYEMKDFLAIALDTDGARS